MLSRILVRPQIRTLAFFFSIVLSCCISLASHAAKAKKDNPVVIFETSSGNITIELFANEAPITVKNFLQYVDEGFYNGTIFHRIVPGFVIQGGGYTFDFQRKPTNPPIKNESDNKLKNLTATLSMARTGVIDSATSQFFINTADNAPLDFSNGRHGYAVFGKVIKGFEVVKKIEKEPRGIHRAHPEAPNYAVVVEKARRLAPATKDTKNIKKETKK